MRRNHTFGSFDSGVITAAAIFIWMLLAGIALLIAGVFCRPCLFIGAALIVISLVMTLIGWILVRRAVSGQEIVGLPDEYRDAMTDEAETAPEEYRVGDTVLLRQHDENTVIINNLYIPGVWNMKDTVGFDDTCTVVTVLSDTSFSFNTFASFRFDMEIRDGKPVCTGRVFTK